MIRKTAIKPRDRFERISSAITNMSVDPEFIRVKGYCFSLKKKFIYKLIIFRVLIN